MCFQDRLKEGVCLSLLRSDITPNQMPKRYDKAGQVIHQMLGFQIDMMHIFGVAR